MSLNIIFPDGIDQDASLSIVDESGRYDMNHYSNHEAETIGRIFRCVIKKYPLNCRSIGLVNEAEAVKYKARYILFEVAIQKYSSSDIPIDQFAVGLAYLSKGSLYRKNAIEFFEKSLPHIRVEDFCFYGSYLPISFYNKISQLYEKEHIWDKALYYLRLAESFCDFEAPYYENHAQELLKKQAENKPVRKRKPSSADLDFYFACEKAAEIFLKRSGL